MAKFDGPVKLVNITLIHDSMLAKRLLLSAVQEFVHILFLFKLLHAATFSDAFRNSDKKV